MSIDKSQCKLNFHMCNIEDTESVLILYKIHWIANLN